MLTQIKVTYEINFVTSKNKSKPSVLRLISLLFKGWLLNLNAYEKAFKLANKNKCEFENFLYNIVLL